eukprot:Sdes_comp20671_c0_seq1m16038
MGATIPRWTPTPRCTNTTGTETTFSREFAQRAALIGNRGKMSRVSARNRYNLEFFAKKFSRVARRFLFFCFHILSLSFHPRLSTHTCPFLLLSQSTNRHPGCAGDLRSHENVPTRSASANVRLKNLNFRTSEDDVCSSMSSFLSFSHCLLDSKPSVDCW